MNFIPSRNAVSRPVRSTAGSFFAAAMILLIAGPAHAQSTWTGNGANATWSTTGNWSTALANSFNTGLVFAGSNNLTNFNDRTSGTATSITFAAGAGAFNIGGNSITLSGNVANNSSNLQTIGMNVTMTTGGGVTFSGTSVTFSGTLTAPGVTLTNNIGSGGRLTLAGSVLGSAATGQTQTLTFDGPGSTVITGPITNGTGGGGLNLSKTGSGWLRLSSTAGNQFGAASVSAGGLIFGVRAAQPAIGTTTVASGATLGLGVSGTDPALFNASDLDALFAGTLAGVSNTAGVSNVGIDTTAGDFSYASNLSGQRGIAKYGPNTLTLSGANSFTGGTLLAEGRILLSNSTAIGSGSATVTNGTLDLGGFSISNPITMLSGTISGGSVSGPVSAGAGAISAVLTGAGGFTKTGTGALVMSASNTYAGTTAINAGTLDVRANTGRLPTTGAVALSSTSGPVNLVIDNVGATGNLSQSIGPLSFGAGVGTVSLVRTEPAQNLLLTSSSINVAAGAAGNLVPNGANSSTNGFKSSQPVGFISTRLFYSGSSYAWNDTTAGFIRGIDYGTDAGTQTITTATTTVSSTTHVQLQANVTAQGSGTFTTLAFTSSGSFQMTGGNNNWITVAGILKVGTGTTVIRGNGSFGNSMLRPPLNADLDIRVDDASGILSVVPGGSTTIPIISANGTNGLTKSGAGKLSLGGLTEFTGPTRPLEGTLEVTGGSGRFPLRLSTLDMSPAGTGTVTFLVDALLGGLTGSRDLNLGGRTITIGNNNASTAYSGILSSGTLVKTGTGTLGLSGLSTFAGSMSINTGGIEIDSLSNSGQASPLGTSATINLGSGANAGTLRYVGGGNTSNRTINILGTVGGTLDASGSGALNLSSGTISAANNTVVTLTGTSTNDNVIGMIAGTGVSVNKTGSGLWRLTGANSYTGGLTVREGTIVAGNSFSASLSPFGSGNATVGGTAGGIGGTAALLIEDGAIVDRSVTIAAAGAGSTQVAVLGGFGSGTVLFNSTGVITLNRSVTLQAANSGTVNFAKPWVNNGPDNVVTIGSASNAGTVELNRDLPATLAGVNVDTGTARLLSSNNRINSATPVTVGSGLGAATLDLNSLSQTLSNLTFAGNSGSIIGGTLRLNPTQAVAVTGTGHVISSLVALDAAASFNVNAASRLGISSAISGSFGLTKTGAGILELSAANTYTGPTQVSGGSLLVNGPLASAVTVQSGGLLGGSGTLNGGVTVQAGGTLSPGNSPGLLTATQLVLEGATLMEIDGLSPRGGSGGFDAVDVTGLLTYGGNMVIDFGSSITTALADNTSFNLFDFGSFTGSFSGITTAADSSYYGGLTFANTGTGTKWTATKGTQTLEFTHSTGVLVIVPEPAAIALAGIGIVAAAYAVRRRARL
jgi:fibronectin-binding autotransporter adhesin